MSGDLIPADVRRFLLTSIQSVPHLEALLLLRQTAQRKWDKKQLAGRLYITEPVAAALLHDLDQAGFLVATEGAYRFAPRNAELGETIARLDEVYSRNLVMVASLIHSKDQRRAQQFSDAFRLRKDS